LLGDPHVLLECVPFGVPNNPNPWTEPILRLIVRPYGWKITFTNNLVNL